MAIKNKDGSVYNFTKPAPQMTEQVFWNKKEHVTLHNKFGQRFIKEDKHEEPLVNDVPIPSFAAPIEEEEKEEEIKIVKHMDDPNERLNTLFEDIVNVWCLPCLEHSETVDPLYGESYNKINYGEKFIFKARILSLEDLQIEFVTEGSVNLPFESVIYPKMANRRWWQIKGYKEVKEYKMYLAIISDYQPSFA